MKYKLMYMGELVEEIPRVGWGHLIIQNDKEITLDSIRLPTDRVKDMIRLQESYSSIDKDFLEINCLNYKGEKVISRRIGNKKEVEGVFDSVKKFIINECGKLNKFKIELLFHFANGNSKIRIITPTKSTLKDTFRLINLAKNFASSLGETIESTKPVIVIVKDVDKRYEFYTIDELNEFLDNHSSSMGTGLIKKFVDGKLCMIDFLKLSMKYSCKELLKHSI